MAKAGELTEKQKIFCREYSIDNTGNVFSSAQPMRLQKNKNGYLTVYISDINKRKRLYVHRLVALAFVENPNNLPEVNHKDLDKTNNNASNLEWTTRKGNMLHMFRNRPYTPPSRAKLIQLTLLNRGKRVLSFEKQQEINALKSTLSQAEISRKVGVSPQTVMRFLRGGMYGG